MREWKRIKGYSGYNISRWGEIQSFKRNKHRGMILKARVGRSGHLSVELFHDGKGKTHFVHRLVAKAFIKNPKNKPQVNHIDGNKTNNYYKNLEWATASENQLHAVNVLNKGRGETCGKSCLTEKDVLAIRKLEGLYSQKQLGEMFGVHESNIGYILRRKTWKHL